MKEPKTGKEFVTEFIDALHSDLKTIVEIELDWCGDHKAVVHFDKGKMTSDEAFDRSRMGHYRKIDAIDLAVVGRQDYLMAKRSLEHILSRLSTIGLCICDLGPENESWSLFRAFVYAAGIRTPPIRAVWVPELNVGLLDRIEVDAHGSPLMSKVAWETYQHFQERVVAKLLVTHPMDMAWKSFLEHAPSDFPTMKPKEALEFFVSARKR